MTLSGCVAQTFKISVQLTCFTCTFKIVLFWTFYCAAPGLGVGYYCIAPVKSSKFSSHPGSVSAHALHKMNQLLPFL